MTPDHLFIDLDGILIEDIEILAQEGSRGIPEFAASSCGPCVSNNCSCVVASDGSLEANGT